MIKKHGIKCKKHEPLKHLKHCKVLFVLYAVQSHSKPLPPPPDPGFLPDHLKVQSLHPMRTLSGPVLNKLPPKCSINLLGAPGFPGSLAGELISATKLYRGNSKQPNLKGTGIGCVSQGDRLRDFQHTYVFFFFTFFL